MRRVAAPGSAGAHSRPGDALCRRARREDAASGSTALPPPPTPPGGDERASATAATPPLRWSTSARDAAEQSDVLSASSSPSMRASDASSTLAGVFTTPMAPRAGRARAAAAACGGPCEALQSLRRGTALPAHGSGAAAPAALMPRASAPHGGGARVIWGRHPAERRPQARPSSRRVASRDGSRGKRQVRR